MANEPLFIGIDAGGSKTELLAASVQGEELLNLFGPSSNPSRVGYDGSIKVLSALIHDAVEKMGGYQVLAVHAGIAGAGRASDQKTIHDGVTAELKVFSPERIVIGHDGEIAVEAAFEGESGVMVVAGTGSVAVAKTKDGELLRAGGWGYLIGDEGSGHAIGSFGLRALAHAVDGGPETMLTDLLAKKEWGIATGDDLAHVVYEQKTPLQKFARIVIQAAEEGDDISLHIVEDQARQLAVQVRWLADRCSAVEPQAALVGGLMNLPFYRRTLEKAILEQLPGWKVIKPMNRPVIGAWRLARERAFALDEARS
jgi:N-acetylglucosamine kinase-like BadF-type ATPase